MMSVAKIQLQTLCSHCYVFQLNSKEKSQIYKLLKSSLLPAGLQLLAWSPVAIFPAAVVMIRCLIFNCNHQL